jgi:hypothetical protein
MNSASTLRPAELDGEMCQAYNDQQVSIIKMILSVVSNDADPQSVLSETTLSDLGYDDGIWFLELRDRIRRALGIELISTDEVQLLHVPKAREKLTVQQVLERVLEQKPGFWVPVSKR